MTILETELRPQSETLVEHETSCNQKHNYFISRANVLLECVEVYVTESDSEIADWSLVEIIGYEILK